VAGGQSLQRQMTTYITVEQEMEMYGNLLDFSVGIDPMLSLQTVFEMRTARLTLLDHGCKDFHPRGKWPVLVTEVGFGVWAAP